MFLSGGQKAGNGGLKIIMDIQILANKIKIILKDNMHLDIVDEIITNHKITLTVEEMPYIE